MLAVIGFNMIVVSTNASYALHDHARQFVRYHESQLKRQIN